MDLEEKLAKVRSIARRTLYINSLRNIVVIRLKEYGRVRDFKLSAVEYQNVEPEEEVFRKKCLEDGVIYKEVYSVRARVEFEIDNIEYEGDLEGSIGIDGGRAN